MPLPPSFAVAGDDDRPQSGDGTQHVVELAAEPVAVRQFRRRVGVVLRDHDLPEEFVERAMLVAAELVTNALEATPPDVSIVGVVAVTRGVVTIEVANAVGVAPDPITLTPTGMPPPSAVRGRGLPLVAALASRLAVDSTTAWVTVSATLVGRPSGNGR